MVALSKAVQLNITFFTHLLKIEFQDEKSYNTVHARAQSFNVKLFPEGNC